MSSPAKLSPLVQRLDPDLERKHELEKQFHVRSIPMDYDEWRVFQCFRKYGLVDNVRLPSITNATGRYRFGFVTMLSYEAADNVRSSLIDGMLKVGDGIAFKVENVNAATASRNSSSGYNDKENNRSAAPNRGGVAQKGFGAPRVPFGNARQPTSKPVPLIEKRPRRVVVTPGVIRGNDEVRVHCVSPPSSVPAHRMAFYCIVEGSNREERYMTMVQQAMDTVQKEQPLLNEDLKDMDYVLIQQGNGNALRGVVLRRNENFSAGDASINDRKVYLMDFGKEMTVYQGDVYPMPSEVAMVPALVCECDFAAMTITERRESSFEFVRTILTSVCDKAQLKVRPIYMQGTFNMVDVFSVFVRADGSEERASIAEGFSTKCSYKYRYNPELAKPRVYDRDYMYKLATACSKMPTPDVIKNEFKTLIRPATVDNAMAQLTVS